MSALTFKLKITPQQRIDCAPLTPDHLAGKPLAEVAAIGLQCGRFKLRTDNLFDISGDDASELIFENSSAKLDNIGQGMSQGRITVKGDAGSYLGLQMKKGEIVVHGNADAFVASGLAGGMIQVHGNVGDFLAAALPGDRKGMRGGIVIVKGDAGDRAGDQMRRGLLLIEGDVGSYCASRMLAGTIGVLGQVGDYVGYGMRRGTLLLTQMPALHATIQDCGAHTLPFLRLMFKSFAGLPSRFADMQHDRVQRYAGDLASDGKGEILVLR